MSLFAHQGIKQFKIYSFKLCIISVCQHVYSELKIILNFKVDSNVKIKFKSHLDSCRVVKAKTPSAIGQTITRDVVIIWLAPRRSPNYYYQLVSLTSLLGCFHYITDHKMARAMVFFLVTCMVMTSSLARTISKEGSSASIERRK